MIVLIDNYDSFVFTLARYVVEAGQAAQVIRNDAITAEQVLQSPPAAIILSPGPKGPCQAGHSIEIIKACAPHLPMLGVCLGHQAIAAAFGVAVVRSPKPVHGQSCLLTHDGSALFAGVPQQFSAARYHSLMVAEPGAEDVLEVTVRDETGLVMGLRHREFPVFGVQFHPESILTPDGHRMIENFLSLAARATEP